MIERVVAFVAFIPLAAYSLTETSLKHRMSPLESKSYALAFLKLCEENQIVTSF